ncbi:hypothetical protein ADUPG1_013960 [Aduncisulcus paluster]|uniref:Uncharacterized protein n=1 Tax=Aduncisulcus paluster TaxID=2918883 RepID=A0ABQ5K506_9EUKA|nr:hypothetical protein ADUPG1_013960 [Aduncisulcus paluster]
MYPKKTFKKTDGERKYYKPVPTVTDSRLTESTISRQRQKVVSRPKLRGSKCVDPKPKLETSSHRSEFYPRPTFRGRDKPLVPYKPESYRNKFKPVETKKRPYKNSSQIRFCDESDISRHRTLKSTYQMQYYKKEGLPANADNPSVLAGMTGFIKRVDPEKQPDKFHGKML